MQHDRPQATFNVLAIAMITLPLTVCELFTVDMCVTLMTLTLTFCDFTFYGNNNVVRIFYCL